jgi:hypothetical protein
LSYSYKILTHVFDILAIPIFYQVTRSALYWKRLRSYVFTSSVILPVRQTTFPAFTWKPHKHPLYFMKKYKKKKECKNKNDVSETL